MIRIQSILVPTDFSQHSEVAATYAAEFASRFNAELHLLHVLQEPLVMGPDPDAGLAMIDVEDLRAKVDASLSDWSEAHFGMEHDVQQSTKVGSSYVEILRYARAHDIDLIVISSHGRTGLMHVLLGSVAERVIRMAPCPVLTVRPEGQTFVMP